MGLATGVGGWEALQQYLNGLLESDYVDVRNLDITRND